jgi:hypothetical protein
MDLLPFLWEAGNENDVTVSFFGRTSNGKDGNVSIFLGGRKQERCKR